MLKRALLCLATALLVAGCASREIEKELEIVDVQTGWYDEGIVDGMNKLVPSVTLRLQNVSQQEIASVHVNAIFRRVGEDQAWGERLVRGIGAEGLAGGATGEPLVLRSDRGYTGEQSRVQMLQNREFVDARVEIFGRHGSRTWVKLGEYDIERQLLTE